MRAQKIRGGKGTLKIELLYSDRPAGKFPVCQTFLTWEKLETGPPIWGVVTEWMKTFTRQIRPGRIGRKDPRKKRRPNPRVLQSPLDEYSVRLGHRGVLSKFAFLSRLFSTGLAIPVPHARSSFNIGTSLLTLYSRNSSTFIAVILKGPTYARECCLSV